MRQLLGATYAGFASWLRETGGVPAEKADAVASVGLGSLISSRLLRVLLGSDPIPVPDEVIVATWVEMMHGLVTAG
jgi:hypothetical protein